MNKTINFVDAQKMHNLHPDTFWVPSEDDLNKIGPDFFVKVCDDDAGERFWVKVTSVNGDKITGTVDNDLISSELEFGEEVIFDKKCVYDIMKP